jgi:RNA polymerase sigma factor (sigma-70 family)
MHSSRDFADEELVRAIQAGGRMLDDAIRYLYRTHYGALGYYVVHNGGDEGDAQDIFQETVLSFTDMVLQGKYRQEASVKTMLFTINRNIWFSEITRRGRREQRNKLFVAGHAETEKNVTDYISGREARSEILKVVEQLGEGCKKILLLFYYENLSMKEILAQTDFENEQVVRNKKYKCLKQLENMMKENPAIYEQLKSALAYVR